MIRKNNSNIKLANNLAKQISVSPKKRKKRSLKIKIFIFIAIAIVTTMILIVLAKLNSDSDVVQGIWTYDQYTQYEFDGCGNGWLRLDTERYDYTYKIVGTKIYI